MKVPKALEHRFYVLYKGDDIVSSGTIQEIHDKTGITISHLVWLTYPTALKRERESKGKRSIMIEGETD